MTEQASSMSKEEVMKIMAKRKAMNSARVNLYSDFTFYSLMVLLNIWLSEQRDPEQCVKELMAQWSKNVHNAADRESGSLELNKAMGFTDKDIEDFKREYKDLIDECSETISDLLLRDIKEKKDAGQANGESFTSEVC